MVLRSVLLGVLVTLAQAAAPLGKKEQAITWGATKAAGVLPTSGESSPVVGVPGVGECIRHAVTNSKNSLYVTCNGGIFIAGENINVNGRYAPSGADDEPGNIRFVDDLAAHKVVMAAAGECHFLALTDHGKVFTWGCNQAGQLGHPGAHTKPYATAPEEVTSISNINVRLVYGGGRRSGVVTDTGKMYMWGENVGEQGEWSTTAKTPRPRLVTVLNKPICQAAMGARHTAVITRDGDLKVWGDGSAGQLGLGDFGITRSKPANVGGKLRKNTCHVAAGEDFTVTISQDARVFLWGSNGFPKPFEKVWFQGKGRPVQVGSGSKHMVVLLADGRIVTWGSQKKAQIGRTTDSSFTLDPGFVETPTGLPQEYSQIAVGTEHTIALASGIPLPSLCMCNHGSFKDYGMNVRFYPTCTSTQTTCPDGACCGADESCCRVSDDVSEMGGSRAVFASNQNTSAFGCFPTKKAVCCTPGSGVACKNDEYCKMDVEPPVCMPPAQGRYYDYRLGMFRDAIVHPNPTTAMTKVAEAAGNKGRNGVCGARKTTCPDDTCCPSGSSCCPADDGFACCATPSAACCGTDGCCAKGYTCDLNNQTCTKPENGLLLRINLMPLESQCGGNNSRTRCPDSSCCGRGKSCCNLGDDGTFGCCPFTDGVCCPDGAGCCPSGHQCDVTATKSDCVLVKPNGDEVRIPMKATPRNVPKSGSHSMTKCDDQRLCATPGSCCYSENLPSRCCPFTNATCCPNGNCCPSGTECSPEPGVQCLAPGVTDVPQKYTSSSIEDKFSPQDQCPGETRCADKTCCPMGSMCCEQADGKTTCCNKMAAVCCSGGGCCDEGHECTDDGKCFDPNTSLGYQHLPTQVSTKPAPPKNKHNVAAPEQCAADQRKCDNGLCCPLSGTCCVKGSGEFGCCPQTGAECCAGGGCCPGGSTCDRQAKSCAKADGTKTPMLMDEPPADPVVEYEADACTDDEQTCSVDGACCLKDQTCCNVPSGFGQSTSECCPHEQGVCCNGGGCCPTGTFCNDQGTTCVNALDEVVEDISRLVEAKVHVKEGLPELDCPDGTTCAPYSTCCSLGYDEEWGEDLYGCCPHEDGVCCAEFEGCCPADHTCDAETESCISASNEFGEEVSVDANVPSNPPPTYVCELPLIQCPNGRCCNADQQCMPLESGNFKCGPRGHRGCGDGKVACPADQWCDSLTGQLMCSEEQDQDPSVKSKIIERFWGEDVKVSCARLASTVLLQQESNSSTGYSPTSKQTRAPVQTWYPKKLVPKQRPVSLTSTMLPTVLAGKVCQHLGTEPDDKCFLSNQNGRFPYSQTARVDALVAEYTRRTCEQQRCMGQGPKGEYVFQAEEVNPCPSRTSKAQDSVGSGEISGEDMEQLADEEAVPESPMLPPTGPVDEQPAHIKMGKGETPVVADDDVDAYSAPGDPMWQSGQAQDAVAVKDEEGDGEMKAAFLPEPYMGKEGCADSINLDSEAAAKNDVKAEAIAAVDVSLAQMNAEVSTDFSVMINGEHRPGQV